MKSVDVIEVEDKLKVSSGKNSEKTSIARCEVDTKSDCYVQYGIKCVETLSSESWKD